MRGEEEIAVAVGILNVQTGNWTGLSACIHEDATGTRYFNMNADTWDGHAFLVDNSAVTNGNTATTKAQAWVWEDDSGSKCNFNGEYDDIVLLGKTAQIGFYLFMGGLVSQNWKLASVGALVFFPFLNLLSDQDDVIGAVAMRVTEDSTANPKKILIRENLTSTTLIEKGRIWFETYP